MPGLTFVNPYTPQTPIGAGLQNIAMALFAGNQAKNAAALYPQRVAQGGMYDAHSELYRAQAGKAEVERKLAERLLAANSEDSIDMVRAAESGVPVHTLRGIDAAMRGEQDLTPYTPEQLAAHRRATVAIRPAYADKTINPVNIADALLKLQTGADRRAIIEGGADPTKTSNAYYATGGSQHAAYDDLAGGNGTFNLMTGVQSLNDIGTARAGAQRSLGLRYDAQAGADRARAGAENARGSKLRAEANNIANGFFGPQTFIDNGDGTVTPRFLGEVAGRQLPAGAKPVDHKPSAATAKPRKITPNDEKMLATALDELLPSLDVDELDAGSRTDILRRAAEQLVGGAASHRTAVNSAVNAAAPEGFEKSGMYGFRTSKPKGGQKAEAAAPASGGRFVAPSGAKYTNEDIDYTARKRGIPRERVIQQLKLQPEA